MSSTDLTMTTSVAQLLLTCGLLLICLPGLPCQKLSFGTGVVRNESSANWTATGRLKLTRQDTTTFEPYVTVQAVTEVCSISLVSCVANGQAPPTSKGCFCTEVSNEEFDIHISSDGDLPSKKLTAQAIVPARHLFKPLALSANIGEIPRVGRKGGALGDRPDRKKESKSFADTATKLKADETIGQLVTTISQLTTQNGELTTQNSQLTTTNNELTTIISQLTTTISQLTTQNIETTTQDNELVRQNNDLTTPSNELTTPNNDLTTPNNDLTTPNNELMTKNNELTTKNNELTTKINELTIKITELKIQNNELTTTISQLTSHISNPYKDICTDVNGLNPTPVNILSKRIDVVCDYTTENGGWVVFQRRTSDGVDFYRDWQQYKDGFGEKPDNFWLGLEAIHQLTTSDDYELRVDLKYEGMDYYAKYNMFRVLGEDQNYKLEVSGYRGDAGRSLDYHNGQYFSTYDRDNDGRDGNCAKKYHGAWWYRNCHHSNLNGQWASTRFHEGLNWKLTTGYYGSVSFSEMKFRPRRP